MTKEKWQNGKQLELLRSEAYYSLGVLAGAGYMALQNQGMDGEAHLAKVRSYMRNLEERVGIT